MISSADIGPELGSGKGEEYDRPFAFNNAASEGRGVTTGIGTGSAYNVARLWGNSSGVPGIGELEGELGTGIKRPQDPAAVSVGFVVGLGLGLGVKLRFIVGEGSEAMVSPHLGKKHDVILTADGSGRSKSNILLLRALLLSVAAEVGGESWMPVTKDVERDGSGVIGRLLPALVGSELDHSPVRLRRNSFLAIPLPRPKAGGVLLLNIDPKRPLDLSLVAP
jgi:hypothetical protein